MCSTTENSAPMYSCPHCDCNFTRSYNLRRHIVRKHDITTYEDIANFSNLNTNFSNLNANFSNPDANFSNPDGKFSNPENCLIENDNANTKNIIVKQKYECSECFHTFSSNWYLHKHMDRCKGVDYKFCCKHCNKKFKHEKSRFKHYQQCSSKAVVLYKDATIPIPIPEGVIQQTNIGTQNNNNTNIQQQQNNNTYNIIIYNHDKTQFNQAHITPEFINKIIRENTSDTRMIQEFSKEILSLPENQCVKKDDLKSAHSKVHIGNNEWVVERDETIYPNLVNTISNEMGETLNRYKETLRMLESKYKKLLAETDYMASEGYINTEDIELQKEKKRNYLQMIKFLKMAIFNQTRAYKRVCKVALETPMVTLHSTECL